MRDWGDLANDIVISHFVIILERRNRRQGNLFVNHLFWPCFNIYSIHYTLDMCVCLIIENILKNTLSSNSIYLIIAHSIDLTWFKHRITNLQTWQQQKENNLLASIFFVAFLWTSTSSRPVRKRMLRTQPRLVIHTYNRYVALITIF